ncbi:hypothetical protein RSAG8_02613, partial [Rhizoctonia solani AG-8 WAC10335]
MVQTSATPKTKSKARYLKAKKERRKKRLKVVATAGNAPSRKHTHPASEDESPSDEEVEGTPERVAIADTPKDPAPSESSEPPKKKRRQSNKEQEPSPLDHDGDDLMTEGPLDSPSRPTSPVELPALPAFPLPTQPAPPSKAVLALQGLDKAILDAEIIDPKATAQVPAPGKPDPLGLGINDRMRERLAELGIESFFAGEWTNAPITPV